MFVAIASWNPCLCKNSSKKPLFEASREVEECAILCRYPSKLSPYLSGTGDSQRDLRESIRANHSELKALFLQRVRPIRTNHSSFRFARITPLSSLFSWCKNAKNDPFLTEKVLGFSVRTPICHIVPASRIYPPPVGA